MHNNLTSLPFPSLVLENKDFHLYRQGEHDSKPLQVRLFKLDWTFVDNHHSDLISQYGCYDNWASDLDKLIEKGEKSARCAELKAYLKNSLGLPKHWLNWIDNLRFGLVQGGKHEKVLRSYTLMASECATIDYDKGRNNVNFGRMTWHAQPMILIGLLVEGVVKTLSDCLVDTESQWWDRRGFNHLLTTVLSYRFWYRHPEWGHGSTAFEERTGYRNLVEHYIECTVLPKDERKALSKKISMEEAHIDELEKKFILNTAEHVFFEQDFSRPGVSAAAMLLHKLFPASHEYLIKIFPDETLSKVCEDRSSSD